MSNGVSTSTDKIIVDRSRSHRNKAVSKAVRATRERLQSSSKGNQVFDRDMLAMHASAVLQGASIMPLFVVLVTAIGVYINPSANLLGWALLMLSLHAINVLLARRASRKEIAAIETRKWRSRLLAAQVLLGFGWALFAIQDCSACSGDGYYFYKGAVLLFAISIMAMSTFMLRLGVLFGFLPAVAVLLAMSVLSRQVLDIGMTAMCAIAVVFFHYIADRLYRSNLTLMSYQSEKDDLIAELEVAKSMSDEARRRAEEANLAKSRFLASMSHELRTPLNAILGFSEVMSSEVLGPLANPTYREYAGDIHRSGHHLLNLINEILDLSRIEAGRYDLSEEALSPVECGEVHAPGRRGHGQSRVDGRRRPVCGHQGQRPRHSGRGNSHRPLGLRSRIDRHQERRTGHRPRPADRAGDPRQARRPVHPALEAARGHRGNRHPARNPRAAERARGCRCTSHRTPPQELCVAAASSSANRYFRA
jgi:two-component system cell cycle sensor histidine kinase PleC